MRTAIGLTGSLRGKEGRSSLNVQKQKAQHQVERIEINVEVYLMQGDWGRLDREGVRDTTTLFDVSLVAVVASVRCHSSPNCGIPFAPSGNLAAWELCEEIEFSWPPIDLA